MSVALVLLMLGVLLLLAILASRVADRVGVPAMLLFLATGMLAGSEGVGGIAFDDPVLAQTAGTVALFVILFAGGLDTRWSAVRPVLAEGLVLSTVGVLLTTLLLGTFAWLLLGSWTTFDWGFDGIRWLEGLLLAAIVSSTDAAAVFSVFRTSPHQPRARIRALLEFESGSNDPMAVLLTTTLLGVLSGQTTSAAGLVLSLAAQLGLGVGIGAAVGWLAAAVVNRRRLPATGLYPTLVLAFGMVAFGAATLLGGNGFLSVYVAGLTVGNRVTWNREAIMNFHDGLSWLAQILMFLMLGLLVFPSQLPAVASVSVALAFFLMFVARPISALVCSLPFRPERRELAYVSWVGLRGSVPIVLATFPITWGLPGGEAVFPVVFFIVLTSVVVQGTTLLPAARWLGVLEPARGAGDQERSADTTP